MECDKAVLEVGLQEAVAMLERLDHSSYYFACLSISDRYQAA